MENAQRLSTTCLQRIMRYFDHVARSGVDKLERLMVTGKVEGKRPRGRSPKRWSDQISEQTSGPLNAALHQAIDRSRWRLAVDGRETGSRSSVMRERWRRRRRKTSGI